MANHRTIVAILAADVAGYSRLVAADEEGTLQRFADYAGAFRANTAEHEGRIFSTAGDSFMVEFPSAVLALRAALAIQEQIAGLNADLPPERRVSFRMGITIGDVMERGDELMGDGVNIAARIQALADPGGICVSRSVHEAVGSKVAVRFRDMGAQKLKNIPRPVPVLRVEMGGAAAIPGRSRLAKFARAAAALLALAVVGGLGWWLIGSKPMWVRSAAVAATPPVLESEAVSAARAALTVSVDAPRQRCFADAIRLSGTIAPRDEVEVRPESEGYKVSQILAGPGLDVTAGQVLAQLIFVGSSASAPVLVRAPVAGLVGRVTASPGSLASPQAPALFTILAGGDLELSADVPLALADRLQPGQSVSVTPIGLPPVTGRLRVLSLVADPATQAAKARITLPGGTGLRPGSFARALVSVGQRCGLAVPSSALLRSQDGIAVYVVGNNTIEARAITTGLSAGNMIEVQSGLGERDMVVQGAGPFLREGDRIRSVQAGRTD